MVAKKKFGKKRGRRTLSVSKIFSGLTIAILAGVLIYQLATRDPANEAESTLAEEVVSKQTLLPQPLVKYQPVSAAGRYLGFRLADERRDIFSAARLTHELDDQPEIEQLDFLALYYSLLRGDFSAAAEVSARLGSEIAATPNNNSNASGIYQIYATLTAWQAGEVTADDNFTNQRPNGLVQIAQQVILFWQDIETGQLEQAERRLIRLEQQFRDYGSIATTLVSMRLLASKWLPSIYAEVAGDDDYRNLLQTQLLQFSLPVIYQALDFYQQTAPELVAEMRYTLQQNPATISVANNWEPLQDRSYSTKMLAALSLQSMATLHVDISPVQALLLARLSSLLEPDNSGIWLQIGQILPRLGEGQDYNQQLQTKFRQQAIVNLDNIAIDDALGLAAGIDRAWLYHENADSEQGIVELQKLQKNYAHLPFPYLEEGRMLVADKQYSQAIFPYDRAIKQAGELGIADPQYFFLRGIAHERNGDLDRAEQDFLTSLEMTPEQPLVLNYLGYTWVDNNVKLAEATDMIKQALELLPNQGFIIDSLGWAYFRQGKYQLALQELEQAIVYDPVEPTINDHLGDVYWKVGRKREARYQWQRALKFKDEYINANAIADKLANGLPDEQ